jgi:hypothetical protein
MGMPHFERYCHRCIGRLVHSVDTSFEMDINTSKSIVEKSAKEEDCKGKRRQG